MDGMLPLLKRAVKPAITSALYHSGFYGLQISDPKQKSWALVLNYHRVNGQAPNGSRFDTAFEKGVTKERFERHMRFLKEHLHPMPLTEVGDRIRKGKTFPPKTVAVTFDDGYLDNYTVAYPILKRYQIPATIFVITELIGTAKLSWWDTVSERVKRTRLSALDIQPLRPRVGAIGITKDAVFPLVTERQKERLIDFLCAWGRELAPDELTLFLATLQEQLELSETEASLQNQMMTWEQAREMAADLVAIESHTHTHPNLSRVGEKQLREELAVSKDMIESSVRQPVRGVAYPFGCVYTDQEKLAQVAGELDYSYACAVGESAVRASQGPYHMSRLGVPNVSLPMLVRDMLVAVKEMNGHVN